jgi:excisionase family DNA binding protein
VTEPLLTAREVADVLGFSPATIVDWAESGKLRAFKVGGRLRFRESELEAWLETKRTGQEEKLSTTPREPVQGVVFQASTTPLRGGEDASP